MKLTKIKTIMMAMIGLFMASDSLSQTWQIGYVTMTFVDASRSNRQIETEVFYPADIAGNGMDLGSPIDKKYPLIVFGHDQNVNWDNYAWFRNRFASQGFIVAFPKTEDGPTMDVIEYAKDLAFVADQVKLMRYQPGSFFYKRYNLKSCLMGHGTGGSAATFAVQYYPSATTMISLAATETVPSAIAAASLVNIPSVVIGGGEDCIAPVASNQMPMFDNIISDCKTFVNMLEARHCDFSSDNGPCAALQASCPPATNIWQFTCINTNYLLISFLRFHLKSNVPALDKFEWKLESKKKDWTYIYSCTQNGPRFSADEDGMNSVNTTDVACYPNPVMAGNSINLMVSSEESTNATMVLTNLMGQVVSQQDITLNESNKAITVSTYGVKPGHYLVSVISNEGRVSKPLIIQ